MALSSQNVWYGRIYILLEATNRTLLLLICGGPGGLGLVELGEDQYTGLGRLDGAPCLRSGSESLRNLAPLRLVRESDSVVWVI